MTSENIEIKIQDKVDPSIPNTLRSIADQSRGAHDGVTKLQAALKSIGESSGLGKLLDQLSKAGLRHQKLQTEVYRTQTAMANMEASLQRAIAAEARANVAITKLTETNNKAALSEEKLSQARNRTSQTYFQSEQALAKAITSENNAATAAQRLATEQQRTQTAMQATALATARVTTEAQRLATAQYQTASSAAQMQASQVRVATAQMQNLTATQRLTNAQQQNATQVANTAAATTRAATAATQGATATQNLANAQARGVVQAQNLATAAQRTATATSNAATAADRATAAQLRLQALQARLAAGVNNTTNAFGGLLSKLALLAGAGYGTKALLDMADSYTTLQNKLQNVSESQAQVNMLTNELFDITNRTRTGIESTATGFARFDRALKQMGKSQQETLRMTETINKALIVSGATTQEASSALLQLSQGFNAGRLMGDEFRAVAENMPSVLDAVAKVLDKPINQIKKLSTEGKITSEVLFKAFESMQGKIDATFARTSATIGQSLAVLRNNAIQFIGEMDKSLGVTRTLSKVILGIAQNLDVLAVAAATAGAAMLVYFGPAIVSAFVAATGAVATFTAVLAADPFGLIAIGITAAIAALTVWGDKITASTEGLYTLQDVVVGVWTVIRNTVAEAAGAFTDRFAGAFDYIAEKFGGFGNIVDKVFGATVDIVKWAGNTLLGVFVAAFQGIEIVWRRFPDMLQGFFNGAYNVAAMAVEGVVNIWVKGLQSVAGMIGTLMPAVADKMKSVLDDFKLELPKMDIQPGVDAAAELGNAFKKAFTTDYLGDFGNAVTSAAQIAANARRAMIDADAGSLRGKGPNTIVPEVDAKAAKAAERRALALQKINAQLDNEMARMFTLQPMREAQQRMDQIEEQLITKKIKLTQSERNSIMEKIKATQTAREVQAKYDELYKEAVGPAREYNQTLEAAQKLLSQGAISQDQYVRAVVKAIEAYSDYLDPLRQVNKELDNQRKLSNMMPREREIEQKMMQQQNELLQKGIVLNDEQTAALRQRLTAQRDVNNVMQEHDRIYSETAGKVQNMKDQQSALNIAFMNGVINLDAYNQRMVQLGIQAANLRLQMQDGSFADVVTASVGKLVEGYNGIFSGVSDAMGNFFQQFNDGFADSIGKAVVTSESLGDALYSVAQNALSSLISALVKLGIQWVINTALGQTLATTSMAATTAASAAAGAATAAAWAPAAAMVSLASFGANAASAMAGIAATTAMSNAMAITKLAGFSEGGFTGNVARDQIAGVVHGQEFVMNASATERIGLGNLMAMNNGASVQGDPMAYGGRGEMSVTVINNAGADIEVRQLSESDVEVIVERKMAKDTDGLVASAIGNGNSKTSRSLSRNTTTARNRN